MRATQRGFGLIDALIALAILSFGLVALTRFQGRMVSQMIDAQSRSTANRFADELVSTALVDPDNLGCYTVPAAGACANATARNNTIAWAQQVSNALPGPVVATATAAGTRFTVVIGWAGKEDLEPRQLTASTDVQ
jgi:type IV pilus assembly protein PilV